MGCIASKPDISDEVQEARALEAAKKKSANRRRSSLKQKRTSAAWLGTGEKEWDPSGTSDQGPAAVNFNDGADQKLASYCC
jgi:hypothetical protein